MYFNVDLEEVEYFGTKNSMADIFLMFFMTNNFFIIQQLLKKKIQ